MEEFFDCYVCQKKVSERERVQCFVENQVPRIPAKSFHKECFLLGLKKQGQTIKCRMCKKEITNTDFTCGYLTGVYYHNECYNKPKCGRGSKEKKNNVKFCQYCNKEIKEGEISTETNGDNFQGECFFNEILLTH